MGNCWSKEGRPSAGCCWNNGSPPSTQQAALNPPLGLGSGPSTSSNNQPPTSPQASTANLFQGLRSDVKDVTDLEKILMYIDAALDKHQKRSNATVKIPELISGNLEDAETALDRISELCEKEVGCNDIAKESGKVLGDVLEGLGNLHWVTSAFSMVAFVLKRLDQVAANKQDCLNILETLQRLGKHLVDLLKALPNEAGTLRKAACLIVEGAILCISLLDSAFVSRFTFVSASKSNIATLKERITLLYPDLILTLNKDMHRLMLKPLKAYDAKYPVHAVGLERIVYEILGAAEQTTQEGSQAILLYGMGGVGKTTIGEAVCAEISARISISVAKVEIGQNPSSETICKCQSDIYERLSGQKERIGVPSEGQRHLEDHFKLRSTPILLFVDNVFRREHLEELLPRKLILPSSSYILVTSRYEAVSQALHGSGIQWKPYDVRGLERSEAEILMIKHLGGCPEDMQEQLNFVLDWCGGWPLALELIGSHLRSRKDNRIAWKSAIENLRKCRGVSGLAEDEVEKILRWSYNEVNGDCQNVFLDISCLLINADWNWIKTLGLGEEWDTLKALSLIKEKDIVSFEDMISRPGNIGKPRARVQVHDLLVALGVRESSSTVRVCSRGGLLPSILQDNHNADECKDVEGLALEGEISLSGKKLDDMHKTLRILSLSYGVQVRGECREVPSKLQICSVWRFPYTDLSGLHDLRVLDITRGDVDFDFELVQFPESLQILQLHIIRSLKRFHAMAFENCSSLHTVRITRCWELEELPASICRCPIHELTLMGNKKLKSLPSQINRLQSLETFYIGKSRLQDPSLLQEFPNGLAKLKMLREASVGGFKKLSEGVDFSQLSRLEYLHLNYGFTETEQLHRGFGKLVSLRTLRIEEEKSLRRLPDDFSQLTALKSLSLRGCQLLTKLPEGFQNLLALSELNLEGCRGLESLPDAFSQLSSLEKLNLRGCTSLREVPGGCRSLVRLSKLNLGGMDSLEQWPDGLSQLTSLQRLHLPRRKIFVALFDFSALRSLKSLTFTECESLTELPLGLGNLVSLSYLEFAGCKSLSLGRLPDDFCQLTSLRGLRMIECEALEELPLGFGNLVSLSDLWLRGCKNLRRLPDDFSQLTSLRRLDMTDCEALEKLPLGFGSLASLSRLWLGRCKSLGWLPDDFSQLTSLQTLEITEVQMLVELPMRFGNLASLSSLELVGCRSLGCLPGDFSNLLTLAILDLSGCILLRKLPDGLGSLPRLRSVSLKGCSSLEKLPGNFGDLNDLSYLCLDGCTNLEDLPESMMRLKGLRFLYLLNCKPKIQQSQMVTQLEVGQKVKVYRDELK